MNASANRDIGSSFSKLKAVQQKSNIQCGYGQLHDDHDGADDAGAKCCELIGKRVASRCPSGPLEGWTLQQ